MEFLTLNRWAKLNQHYMFVYRMPSGVSDVFSSEFERAHNRIPLAETESVFYLSSVVVPMWTNVYRHFVST